MGQVHDPLIWYTFRDSCRFGGKYGELSASSSQLQREPPPPWPLSEALFPINGTFFFHLHENNMKTPRALKTELVELFAFPTNMPLTSLDQEFQPHFKKYRLNIYQIRKVKKKEKKSPLTLNQKLQSRLYIRPIMSPQPYTQHSF
jgi:hypothetical protein